MRSLSSYFFFFTSNSNFAFVIFFLLSVVRAPGTGQFDVPVDQKSKSSVLVVSLVERGLLRKMASVFRASFVFSCETFQTK